MINKRSFLNFRNFVLKSSLALFLMGCEKKAENSEFVMALINSGYPIRFVDYIRPDPVILTVYDELKQLNDGKPYEIKIGKPIQTHLCFDGVDGFRYEFHGSAKEERNLPEGVKWQLSFESVYGSLSGDPYQSSGAVLAEELRENELIRNGLIQAYEHREELISGKCSI
jgi:hypothetical protein